MSANTPRDDMGGPMLERCKRHDTEYVPSTGPGDPNAVPCPGCVIEAEAYWRQAEDHNIGACLSLGEAPDA